MASLIENLDQLSQSLEAIDAQANEVVVNTATQMVKDLTADSNLSDDYAESFEVSYDSSGYFIVKFNPKSKEVEEEEKGKGPFDMRTTMLRPGAPGVKVAKSGYLYRNIPLNKSLMSSATASTKSNNEQQMQKNIRDVIARAKFQVKAAMQVGDRFVVEESATNNNGIMRVKSYASQEDYQKKRIPKMSFIAFRTISTNPNSKASWIHPGWSGDNVQSKVHNWLQDNSEKIRVEVINELITTYLTGI